MPPQPAVEGAFPHQMVFWEPGEKEGQELWHEMDDKLMVIPC